jgi:hypothetical protein
MKIQAGMDAGNCNQTDVKSYLARRAAAKQLIEINRESQFLKEGFARDSDLWKKSPQFDSRFPWNPNACHALRTHSSRCITHAPGNAVICARDFERYKRLLLSQTRAEFPLVAAGAIEGDLIEQAERMRKQSFRLGS